MKKFIPVVAAVLTLGMVFSGPAYVVPKDNPKSEKVKKVEENQQSNKGQTQRLKSIDKQLDKIEEKITHYKEKLPNLDKSIEDLEEETLESNDQGAEEQLGEQEDTKAPSESGTEDTNEDSSENESNVDAATDNEERPKELLVKIIVTV